MEEKNIIKKIKKQDKDIKEMKNLINELNNKLTLIKYMDTEENNDYVMEINIKEDKDISYIG